jgi:hypothetical protein
MPEASQHRPAYSSRGLLPMYPEREGEGIHPMWAGMTMTKELQLIQLQCV